MSGEGTMQLENLVEQAKRGDQQAFEALYQQTGIFGNGSPESPLTWAVRSCGELMRYFWERMKKGSLRRCRSGMRTGCRRNPWIERKR